MKCDIYIKTDVNITLIIPRFWKKSAKHGMPWDFLTKSIKE